MPQAAQVPNPVAADSTGLPDSSWIGKVRDSLEDYPRWLLEQFAGDGINGVSTAGAAPWGIQSPKINGSSAAGDNTPLVQDTTGPVNYVVVDFPTVPTAGQVQVNYDTGEFTFFAAPPNGHTLNVSYQTCKLPDQSILDALADGLRDMFPAVGKTYSAVNTQTKINKWYFQLPPFF